MRFSSSLPSLMAAVSLLASPAAAKPEQIRAVQDPIFHYYLQAYPQNRNFVLLDLSSHWPPYKARLQRRREKEMKGHKAS